MIQEKCPYVEKCGACHMGQTTYEEELIAKKELVESHIGKYCRNIHDVAGMYYPFHYRNKVHAVFGRLKDEVIAGHSASCTGPQGNVHEAGYGSAGTACPEFPHKNNFVAE